MKILRYHGRNNLCGRRIRQARERLGITQEQLAARMQVREVLVNQKAVSRMENGERVVTDYELKALAETLQVSLKWLLEEAPEER